MVMVSIHTIMSTTHRHQVVGKCHTSEACEFTGNYSGLGRGTLFFFRVMCSWSRRCRVSVSAVGGLDLGKMSARARFALEHIKNWQSWSTF